MIRFFFPSDSQFTDEYVYLSCIENFGRVPFNSKLLVQFGKQKMDMETFKIIQNWGFT